MVKQLIVNDDENSDWAPYHNNIISKTKLHETMKIKAVILCFKAQSHTNYADITRWKLTKHRKLSV